MKPGKGGTNSGEKNENIRSWRNVGFHEKSYGQILFLEARQIGKGGVDEYTKPLEVKAAHPHLLEKSLGLISRLGTKPSTSEKGPRKKEKHGPRNRKTWWRKRPKETANQPKKEKATHQQREKKDDRSPIDRDRRYVHFYLRASLEWSRQQKKRFQKRLIECAQEERILEIARGGKAAYALIQPSLQKDRKQKI